MNTYAEAIEYLKTNSWNTHENRIEVSKIVEDTFAQKDRTIESLKSVIQSTKDDISVLLAVIRDSVREDYVIEEASDIADIFDRYGSESPWNPLVCSNCGSDLRDVGVHIEVEAYFSFYPDDGEESVSIDSANLEEVTSINSVLCNNCNSFISEGVLEVTTY